MRDEKAKWRLRTKAVKQWEKGRKKDPTNEERKSFITGFNMGWKACKKFLRKRVKRESVK